MKDSVMVCLYQGTGGNLGVLFFFFLKRFFSSVIIRSLSGLTSMANSAFDLP